MIRIFMGGDEISYTAGDSFILNISSVDGFADGTVLKFRVAENEQSGYLIDAQFPLLGGGFTVELTDEEKSKLPVGEYIYKVTVVGNGGNVVTQKSGNLKVKWGA